MMLVAQRVDVTVTYLMCSLSFQPTPRGSKGKLTNDPIKFLPVLPEIRTKPAWQVNQPTFMLSGKLDDSQEKNGFDVVHELTAS